MSESIDALHAESAVRAAADVRIAFSRLKRRLKELATDEDLTPAQASVLARLDAQGSASASELATGERGSPQFMAKTVEALVRADLVVRHPDPLDGRRQLITLTVVGTRPAPGSDRWARQEWLAQSLQERCTEQELRTISAAMALLDEVARSRPGARAHTASAPRRTTDHGPRTTASSTQPDRAHGPRVAPPMEVGSEVGGSKSRARSRSEHP
ncbi:MarR family winged helix-turn-helix transcriptional regulator [Streptomyces noursei]|uniref:MarR family winged helix-turn-helix transcriptional regulator n=1 Tax=Streptomyces noursei TaxID=1971 RepID=UPI00288328CF|nr:MarR family winged helix-turn-helix transcriptional regulator [Streptomyces noursei]